MERENFAYFDKPIDELSDNQLIDFWIQFCNGAEMDDPRDQKDYKIFQEELPKRSQKFQDDIAYINLVL